jgi:UDP-N-acetylmuramate dehydrogenase
MIAHPPAEPGTGLPAPARRLTRGERDQLWAELGRHIVRFDEPMTGHTSFRIGGPADALLLPHSVDEVQRVVVLARRMQLSLTVIGNGSNLLVRDGGLRGLVLKIADNLAEMRFSGTQLWVQAGALLRDVARTAGERSLAGLEFAVGIPGTLGGAVIMNAGAYGGEMKDVVTRVTAVDDFGKIQVLDPDDLRFGYRCSSLQGRRWIVADATMELVPGDASEIVARMADLTHQRESRQPLEMPSAGSVFKRPPGRYVGPMIEELGLKGYAIGGAQVSAKHAGFIVNAGGATARDVLALIDLVRGRVQERFGVWLETEVKVIGEEA